MKCRDVSAEVIHTLDEWPGIPIANDTQRCRIYDNALEEVQMEAQRISQYCFDHVAMGDHGIHGVCSELVVPAADRRHRTTLHSSETLAVIPREPGFARVLLDDLPERLLGQHFEGLSRPVPVAHLSDVLIAVDGDIATAQHP
jgi:hypothetical protein